MESSTASHMPAIARSLHKAAIGLYHRALNAQMDGRAKLARAEFSLGYRVELLTLKFINYDIQPLAATIEGSAAILAFHAGAKSDAIRLANASLRNLIPESLAGVLHQIIGAKAVKGTALPRREHKRVEQGGRCVIIGFDRDV